MDIARGRAASFLIAIATAFTVIALVMPLFLNPVWVGFEQSRSQATAWTGYTEPQLRGATNAILADLIFGPPAFDVQVEGQAVLTERERSHMGDVRGVFIGFFAVAAVLAIAAGTVVVHRRQSGPAIRARTWGAVRNGAIGLVVGLIVVGAVSFVAFDALFEVFHQVFFAGGTYTFDPTTERLVQLFPFQFWQETAVVLGVVAAVAAVVVAALAHRRTTVVQGGSAASDRADATAAPAGSIGEAR